LIVGLYLNLEVSKNHWIFRFLKFHFRVLVLIVFIFLYFFKFYFFLYNSRFLFYFLIKVEFLTYLRFYKSLKELLLLEKKQNLRTWSLYLQSLLLFKIFVFYLFIWL
jgi:hypothetical protein